MTTTLLSTKLYIPTQRPNIVQRPSLIERLNVGLSGKLTLISAPVGFGKSTLLSAWVQQADRPVAWLSLDESDNDLTRFLIYFVAALQTIDSNIGQGVLIALQSPEAANIEVILTTLLNEISELPDNVVLILDDYHMIDSQPIDKAITFILDHLPSRMHLVIASRSDPTLPLSRLRVRGQIAEIRADALRFSLDEAAVFLKQVMGFDLSAQDVAALGTRIEGWAAGLQLAALSMQGSGDVQEFVRSFTGSNRFIVDYLGEEVLSRQPRKMQDFLLQTSLLDRLTGPLCDAVTGSGDGEELLEKLERGNLFVISLDNERRWYRYHHLFADLLTHHLRRTFPDLISELHSRASSWYQIQGYTDEAVRHAQAAGDNERAADILGTYWAEYIHRGELVRLKHLLNSLSPEVVKKSAPLSMAAGWLHYLTGPVDSLPGHINDIRKAMKQNAVSENVQQPIEVTAIPSMIEMLEATVSLDNKQIEKAKAHAKKAIALIPDDPNPRFSQLLQAGASSRLAQAHRELGENDQASVILLEVLELLKACEDHLGVANTILQIVGLYQEAGKTQEAVTLCVDTLGYYQERQWEQISPGSGMVNVILAGLQADSGGFEKARKNLEIGRGLVKRISSQKIISLMDEVEAKLDRVAPPSQPLVEPLSPREIEVLQLIAQGLSNREICERLYLSMNTIKGHNRNIYGKLGAKSRTEAVNKATSLKIIGVQ